ncbi:protein phosphatase CheZ [Pseudomonas putida]|uniref:Protein phosphatase CheZ n=1 Tax=Pseudomonas putida TaxID=303 RepID=A0A8I1EBN3_PSEPU|nr:protein phosphatase CheZ [Pseudomonas putida]MBI6882830.1 protein phosphatase CheZ [Pseudomonas putida]
MTTHSQNQNNEVIQRIGHLTRMVRVSMHELGLNREIEKAAQAIPDTRDRLAYIATMTEQAANRVLSSIERISPLHKELDAKSRALLEKLTSRLAVAPDGSEEALLLQESIDFMLLTSSSMAATQKEMLEITMAQDFQDLTGQVVKKMIEVIKVIEHQLVQVLLESSNETSEEGVLKRLAESEWEDEKKDSLMNGPQIKPTEGDAVSNQDQVDDLLDSLGF